MDFLIRGRGRPAVYDGRASGILSVRGAEVSLGRFGSVLYTCKRLHRVRRRFNHFWSISLSSPRGYSSFFSFVCFQGSRGALDCRIDGVCGAGAYPQPDLPREASRSRSAYEKSK